MQYIEAKCSVKNEDAVGQAMFQLHLSDPQFYCLLRCSLYKRFDSIEYHIYIWLVMPQLCCSITCQIWTRLDDSKSKFFWTEEFAALVPHLSPMTNNPLKIPKHLLENQGQYHICSWPGDAKNQIISSYGMSITWKQNNHICNVTFFSKCSQ